MALRYDDLGDTEIVSTISSHKEKHIEALESRVDDLEEENRLLKRELASKPSIVTQEAYDELCRKYQMEINKYLPF